MGGRSVTQEYYMLAVNEKGYMPAMRSAESNAGLVVAAVAELLLNGVITMGDKKLLVGKELAVVKELPGELGYLASLYGYLREKTRSTGKLMNDYLASTGSRIRQLTCELGAALVEADAAKSAEGGLFGGKVLYVPERDGKEAVVRRLKSAIVADGELSVHDAALLAILRETKNLSQYFSAFERDVLQERLKELKQNPRNRELAKMIEYVSDMTGLMAVLFVVGAN